MITFNNNTVGNLTTTSNQLSFSITTGALSNGLLVVGGSNYNEQAANNSIWSSVTFNGSSFTQAAHEFYTDGSTFDVSVDVWYLLAPANTTANVVITFQGNVDNANAFAARFEGVKQTSPLDTSADATHLGTTTHTNNMTTTADGDLLIDVIDVGTGTTLTPHASQTSLMNALSSSRRGSYKIVGAAGAQTMTWTSNNTTDGIHSSAAFFAAPSATTRRYSLPTLSVG